MVEGAEDHREVEEALEEDLLAVLEDHPEEEAVADHLVEPLALDQDKAGDIN